MGRATEGVGGSGVSILKYARAAALVLVWAFVPAFFVQSQAADALARNDGGFVAAPPSATETEIQALKQQLLAMQRRIEQLERQQAQQVPRPPVSVPQTPEPAKAVMAGDIRNSIKIPGSETSLSWGGYAKLDAIFNSVAAPGANNAFNQVYVPGAIPLDNQKVGEKNKFLMNARESRLWFKAFRPTDMGDFNAHVEFDIYSLQAQDDERTGNGNSSRLRHAYGSLGKFLAGQTWSTFLNTAAVAETSDLDGPAAVILIRQAQVRYTSPFADGSFQLAAENPETTLNKADGTRLTPSDDRYPDLIGRVNFNRDWGQVSLAGMARQLRSDGALNAGVEDSRWGGGINLAGMIKTGERDNFKFSATWGNAVGRYLGLNAFNDGYIDGDGKIHMTDVWGGYGAYQHWWTPALRSTWVLSYAKANNQGDLIATTVNKQVWSSHLNLMWSPVPATTFAAEWLHAGREVEKGTSGDLNRLQMSAKYEF